jgi:hypothetical protein
VSFRCAASLKSGKKANKLELNWNDLFSKQADLVNAKTTQLSEFPIDMSTLKNQLQEQALYEITKLTDKSFVGAVKAQEVKQTKGLDNLENVY